MRTLARICGILLATLTFSLIGLEVYLRQVNYLGAMPSPYPCMQGDPVYNHSFRPNCIEKALAANLRTDRDVMYKTNSMGYRSSELIPDSPKILFLGDSYTEGFGLANEETFASVFAGELERFGYSGFQVINAGVSGYSTVIQQLQWRNQFQDTNVQHVVLNFDITDLQDNFYYYTIADFSGEGEIVGVPPREIFPQKSLGFVYSDRSAALRFVHQELNLLNLYRLRKQREQGVFKLIAREPQLIDKKSLQAQGIGHCHDSFEFSAKLIMQLKKEIESTGAKLHVHMYPPGYFLKKFQFPAGGLSLVRKAEFDYDRSFTTICDANHLTFAAFARFAEEQGISFHSSYEVLKSHPHLSQLYFDRDAHFTAKGAKVVMRELANAALGQPGSWQKTSLSGTVSFNN